MAKIYAPVAAFSGVVAGVQFIGGEGETDRDAALAYFARQGYRIVFDAPEPEPDDAPADEPAPAEDETKPAEDEAAPEPKPATKRSVKPKSGASGE